MNGQNRIVAASQRAPNLSAKLAFCLVCLSFGDVCLATQQAQFFILWGSSMQCAGELRLRSGRIVEAEPYRFAKTGSDSFEQAAGRVSWSTTETPRIKGVEIVAEMALDAVIELKLGGELREIPWSNFPSGTEKVLPLPKGKFFVLGRGDPRRGPRQPLAMKLPPLYQPPKPVSPVALPAEWWKSKAPIRVRLSQMPAALQARRVMGEAGRLCLEFFSPGGPLQGLAEIQFNGAELGSVDLHGSLWLALSPRLGTMPVIFESDDRRIELTVATTLVETRGTQLLLNGEPFLIKGAMARDLNDSDAAYLKTLGLNTLRGPDAAAFGDRYDFMAIAALQKGPQCVSREDALTDADYFGKLAKYLDALENGAPEAAASSHTLILQVGNEQHASADPWEPRLGKTRPFERLDYLLASARNLIKPLAPMIPVGYANHAFGYIAPGFLDVYMHNSYIAKDKFDFSMRQFMELQGCLAADETHPGRPFVNSEFGANVYLPQTYLGGPNNPVLEKLQAWNYIQRWREYLEAGTVGGTCYCLYDLEKPTDHGSSCFGILTFERQPKLACWELWHLWRDFEVTLAADNNPGQLRIQYRRGYWARDCRLTIKTETEQTVLPLEDFRPREERLIRMPSPAAAFRWRMDFTTHGGLTVAATGAYPAASEEADFLDRLKPRATFDFLSALFDAEVLTASGQPAPPTTAEMARADGIIPIAFRKRNGEVYFTLITRQEPKDSPLKEGLTVEVAFSGRIEVIDDMTGQPTGERVEAEVISGGLRLKNARAAHLPGAYGKRSPKPFTLPVYRIRPQASGRQARLTPLSTFPESAPDNALAHQA